MSRIDSVADLLDLTDGTVYGCHDILSDYQRDAESVKDFFERLTDEDRWTLMQGLMYAVQTKDYAVEDATRNLTAYREGFAKFLKVVGPAAIEAAKVNRLCEEYENLFGIIGQAVMWEHGPVVSMVRDFVSACDRREDYTVTLTLHTRNRETAQELLYALRDEHDAVTDFDGLARVTVEETE